MAGYLHAFKRIKHLKGLRKPYEETRRFLGPDMLMSVTRAKVIISKTNFTQVRNQSGFKNVFRQNNE